MWWVWVLGGLVGWLVLATLCAPLLGRGIRMAGRRSPGTRLPLTDAALPSGLLAATQVWRRAIPLPPVGVALAAFAVTLETCGYVIGLTGADGPAARLLSMDAPLALPRMFVATLFTAASVAGVAAAARFPGRRTWWSPSRSPAPGSPRSRPAARCTPRSCGSRGTPSARGWPSS